VKKRLTQVAELGCLVCGGPAEIHHVRLEPGMPRDDDKVIPLCPRHHRSGGHGVAIHAGKKTWEEQHGTEAVLLTWVDTLVIMRE